MRGYRVWAEIDLKAVQNNLQTIFNIIGPKPKLLAVVKADAYGHGAVPVAWKALECGAAMLGVGDSTEAIQLRESGIAGPITILGAIIEEEIPRVVEYDIVPTVHSMDFISLLNEEAKRQSKKVNVHLKVDTGMGRLGSSPQRAVEIAKAIDQSSHIKLEGIATHLSAITSRNREYTELQLSRFNEVLGELQNAGIRPPLVHAANSVGAFLFPQVRFDMVRVGISMYGIDPGVLIENGHRLNPVLSLKTRIAFLKSVPAGSYIGYEQKHQVQNDTRIATLPVGYNDGYPYLLSNKGEVLIRGQRAPVVGTVTMDYIMVDVGRIDGVSVHDEVTLIGRDGQEEIKVVELARKIGTIPYEITCALGKRVKRVYV